MEALAELDILISSGEVIVLSSKASDSARRYVQFRLRGDGGIFSDPDILFAILENVSTAAQTVFDFLNENGASYVRDVEMGTGLSQLQLQHALRELADQGLASCENYRSLLIVLQSAAAADPIQTQRTAKDAFSGRPKHPTPLRRGAVRKMVQTQTRMKTGRWFLTTSFAIMGKILTESERATAQARLLLQRYGVLVKEFYRRENGLLPWYRIFQSLKRLEWQGEIRRGYFVEGLSGVQFALPEALELLEKIHHKRIETDHHPLMISSMDPALPYGGTVEWNMTGAAGRPLKILRSPANHLVFVDDKSVLYAENWFHKLSCTADMSKDDFATIVPSFSSWLKMPVDWRPQKRIKIGWINDHPAINSQFAEQLIQLGYEKEGDDLFLWPSAI
jgi:ATP-dependent Lhr-like helicase